jgi:uncharacterized membrane protein YdjX (TVP38/TMEM64 family)
MLVPLSASFHHRGKSGLAQRRWARLLRDAVGNISMSGSSVPPLASCSVPRWTKKHFVLAVVLAGLVVALVLVVLKSGAMEAVDAMILGLRAAGPAVFFVAMALLPAVGFPMIAFTLAAGPVFVPTLGVGGVIAWSLAAVVVNLLLTYWLADRAVRPLVNRLLTYFEIRLPDKSADGAWQMALIVRLMPGPPFWVQSYLLGLMRVPLVPYLVVSTLVMAGCIVALVCGGEAITRGNGRLAFAALGIVVVLVAMFQLVRQRARRRRAETAAALPLLPSDPLSAK